MSSSLQPIVSSMCVLTECWIGIFFRHIPYFGQSLQAPFKEYLVKQKRKLHHKRGASLPAVCLSRNICDTTVHVLLFSATAVDILPQTGRQIDVPV